MGTTPSRPSSQNCLHDCKPGQANRQSGPHKNTSAYTRYRTPRVVPKYASSANLAYFSLQTTVLCGPRDIASLYYKRKLKKTSLTSRRRAATSLSIERAVFLYHLQQTAPRCSAPNKAEAAHKITANSQTRSETKTQSHKIANALQTVQQNTQDYAT